MKPGELSSRPDDGRGSRSLFGRTTPAPAPAMAPRPPAQPAAAPAAQPSAASASTASAADSAARIDPNGGNRLLVGPDVKLKGAEILDCDTLVVEGRVEATMDSRVIRIAEQGCFNGNVSIDTAEIHGSFEGELTARSQLLIHATGRVSGKIRYGKILIEEGGQISGDIQAIATARDDAVVRSSSSASADSTLESRTSIAVAR